jgi:hypothetical protein
MEKITPTLGQVFTEGAPLSQSSFRRVDVTRFRADTLEFCKAEQHGAGWCSCLQPVWKLCSLMFRWICCCCSKSEQKPPVKPNSLTTPIPQQQTSKSKLSLDDLEKEVKTFLSSFAKDDIIEDLAKKEAGNGKAFILFLIGDEIKCHLESSISNLQSDMFTTNTLPPIKSSLKEALQGEYRVVLLVIGAPESSGNRKAYLWSRQNQEEVPRTETQFALSKGELSKYIKNNIPSNDNSWIENLGI